MRFSSFGSLSRLLPVLALAAACGAVGCGGNTGTVSGKVVYNGTVVKGGVVSFNTQDGHAASADIQEDGTYRAVKVPLGEVKVTVNNKMYKPRTANVPSYKPPPGQGPSGGGYLNADPEEAKRRYVPIPDDYAGVDKTPLTYTVTAGSQTYDPPLK